MGHKGGQAFSGAKGPGTQLDLAKALRQPDEVLVRDMEQAALNQAQKRAQEVAPKMIGHLEDVAEFATDHPGARVSAAKAILDQAHGRPEARDPNKGYGADMGLIIQIVQFNIEGKPMLPKDAPATVIPESVAPHHGDIEIEVPDDEDDEDDF